MDLSSKSVLVVGAGIMGADAAELAGERAALALLEDRALPFDAARAARLEANLVHAREAQEELIGVEVERAALLASKCHRPAALGQLPDHVDARALEEHPQLAPLAGVQGEGCFAVHRHAGAGPPGLAG